MHDAAQKAVGGMVGEGALSFTDSPSCSGWGRPAGESTSSASSPSPDPERLADGEFRTGLATLTPQLRALARSLCRHRDLADDLTQEAMLKAWEARGNFQAGTNLRAWVFVILRNTFISQMRRARFVGEWDEALAARVLSTPPSQEHHLHFGDLQRAMKCLPETQRQALILVAAGGFSCEEAAQICGCALGTIKSRVARARTAIERMFADGSCPPRAKCDAQSADALEAVANEVHRIVDSRDRFGKMKATPAPNAWLSNWCTETVPQMFPPVGTSWEPALVPGSTAVQT